MSHRKYGAGPHLGSKGVDSVDSMDNVDELLPLLFLVVYVCIAGVGYDGFSIGLVLVPSGLKP
jgi:hypothetical protein